MAWRVVLPTVKLQSYDILMHRGCVHDGHMLKRVTET